LADTFVRESYLSARRLLRWRRAAEPEGSPGRSEPCGWRGRPGPHPCHPI